MKMIEVKNLSYTYSDGTIALNNISIDIEGGKKIAILGSNGSGKSTLLQHLNGLILPQKGVINISNQRVNKKNLCNIREKVGFVFDNPDNQLFAQTVYDDIAFGPRNMGLGEEEINDRVSYIIDLLNIGLLKDKQPFNLSLGQKKKVALGGVLSMNPDIMVFDEPFSGLDPLSQRQFLDILDTLYELKHTLIITTHDVDMAYSWADEYIILNKGEVLAQGDKRILEDKKLMELANLEVPKLYDIFSSTDLRAYNIDQCKKIVNNLFISKGGYIDEKF